MFRVLSATVFTSEFHDILQLRTDMPNPNPEIRHGMVIVLTLPKHTAVDYVRQSFNLETAHEPASNNFPETNQTVQ